MILESIVICSIYCTWSSLKIVLPCQFYYDDVVSTSLVMDGTNQTGFNAYLFVYSIDLISCHHM